MVTIVQLSDTHLLARDAPAYGVVDTAAALDAAVDHIRSLPATIGRIDAVVATGDIADLGEPEAYERFRAAIAALDAPAYVLPGNHDDRELLRAAFAADGYLPRTGPSDFELLLGDLLVLGVDSAIPGAAGGEIGEARQARLDKRLAAHDGPAAIFLHHPPRDVGVAHMDKQKLSDGEALAAIAARRPNLGLIACGHVHRMIVGRIGSATMAVAPAPAHAVRLDLRPDAPSDFMLEPGGVLVHRLTADGAFTCLHSFIDRFRGPYPFFS